MNQPVKSQDPLAGGQPPASQLQGWSTPAGVLGSNYAAPTGAAFDQAPAGLADAAGDPLFWAVFGLVVLGHLVQVAGFGERQ